MREDIKISVIMPVYNCANSIIHTIESITSQLNHNYEIIVVDDGSTDQLHFVLEKYLCNHNLNVHIIKQKNAGPGAARNLGLTTAQGEFVFFVDADDCCLPNYFSSLINGIEDADMCFCSYEQLETTNKNSTKRAYMKSERLDTLSSEKRLVSFLSYKSYISLWNSVFRLSVIRDNNLFFLNVYHSEDIDFIMRYLTCCRKVKYVEDSIYQYHYDPLRSHKRIEAEVILRDGVSIYDSLLKRVSILKWNDARKALVSGRIPVYDMCQLMMEASITDSVNAFKSSICSDIKKVNEIRKIKRGYLKKKIFIKTKLMYFIFKLSPDFFCYISKLFYNACR